MPAKALPDQTTLTAPEHPASRLPGADRASHLPALLALDPERAVREAEHEAATERLKQALRIGLLVWAATGLLDWWVVQFIGAGSLRRLLLLRALGLPVGVAVLARLGRPTPPSRGWLRFMDVAVFSQASLLVSVMCLHLGSIASPYATGIVLILVARGATMFDHWRTGIWLLGVPALSYPAVMMVAGLLFPDVRAQFTDPHRLGLFGVNLTFIATGWLLLTTAGNFVWNVRREAREPRRIGRYRLERRLGRGGMGEVWAARDPRREGRVALKLLRGPARKRAAVARFEREIRALAGLSHPNIVSVFDFGVTDEGTWYYAMELLEGQNLRELVERQGPLPPDRVAALATQIAGALVEAHAGGVVHRDIKPDNIFVVGGPSGLAKLLDFGIAKTLGEEALTATGWVPGTPAYMSPEALRGQPADPRSDIYALGCTLQFALTGTPPGERVSGPIPAPLAAVIRRCLEGEPAARFPNSQALLLALECLPPAAGRFD